MVSGREGVTIQSVVRAMDILKFIGSSGNNATLKSISEELQLSHSTVHNILRTLKQEGFVLQTQPGAPYSLGYIFFDLYRQMSATDSLLHAAKYEMDILSAKYNESCNLAVLDQFEVLYIYNTDCDHDIRLFPAPGMRSLAYSTACGKVLLASLKEDALNSFFSNVELRPKTECTITNCDELRTHLTQIRNQGYAIDNYELSMTTRCFGAPIFNDAGKTVAAISLSFPDNRSDNFDDNNIIKDIISTATAISEKNGYRSRHLNVAGI